MKRVGKILVGLGIGAIFAVANPQTPKTSQANPYCKLKAIYISCLQQAQKGNFAGNQKACVEFGNQIASATQQEVLKRTKDSAKASKLGKLVGITCTAGCLKKADMWNFLQSKCK
jgi:hypothetical protein